VRAVDARARRSRRARAARRAARRRTSGGVVVTRKPPSSSVTGEILGAMTTRRRKPDPTAIVIFGATGGLSGRKLAPARFTLMLDQSLTEPTVIMGVSRSSLTPQQFAERLQPRVAEFSRQKVDPGAWDKYTSMLDYVGGEFHEDATYETLKQRLAAAASKG